MPRISQRSIDEIRNRVSIVDVAGQHVRLQKAGRSFKGLSPFNSEKSPSFHINPDKNVFYCFSSGQGGDVIKFVELVEGLSFFESLEALAQRYSIKLEYEEGSGAPSNEDRTLRRELLDIHDLATSFYHEAFFASNSLAEEVRTYWVEQRRFSFELAKEFKIGFAPPADDALGQLVRRKGFSVEAIRECGMFFIREGDRELRSLRSRFRGRLMIPIREATQGQVVAFTARKLDCTPTDDPSHEAKYVNSPGTPLFQKSRVLFNLDRARMPARDDPHGFLLVEGQLDALRCYSSGFKTAVAPQGTALTEEQLALLKRHNDRIHIVLDGDTAGQRAALRALPMCFGAGVEPRFVILPAGSDPDSILAEGGPAALESLVAAAVPPMAFAARALLPNATEATPRERAHAMQEIFSVLCQCQGEVARSGYLDDAALQMGVNQDAARRDFAQFLLAQHRRNANRAPQAESNMAPKSKPERLTSLETDLFCLILHYEELADRVAKVVDDKWLESQTLEGRLLGRLLWELRDGACEGVPSFLSSIDDEQERRMAYSLHVQAQQNPFDDPEAEAEKLLLRIFFRFRQRRIEEIDRMLMKHAEPKADITALLHEKIELLRTVKTPPRIAL